MPDDPQSADNEQTGWDGGFDLVLGNPPWERIKLLEKEWFAERAPEIANASNASTRRQAIADLEKNDPYLLQAFSADKRVAEGESHFVRLSARYPLCGRGDINTYTIFAETCLYIMSRVGRVGIIVPSGIATDDTTKYFFQRIMTTGSLASLYDFENRRDIFPGVGHGRFKFSLLTLTGIDRSARTQSDFVFFALGVEHLEDNWRHFTLSAEDMALLNPNTRTCPIFRSKRDAEITKTVYRAVPVLIVEEQADGNSWGMSFLRMFDMTNDAHLFIQPSEVVRVQGSVGGVHRITGEAVLPLHEGRFGHQFNHRYATNKTDDTYETTINDLQEPILYS